MSNSWGLFKLETISNNLNRTEVAIIQKADKLSLGASYLCDEYLSAREVGKILSINQKTILNWINNHGLKSTKKAIRKQVQHRISIDDLMEFLKDNTERFDSRKLELNVLGIEPEWLKEKRKDDFNRPRKQNEFWTVSDGEKALKYFHHGVDYEQIGAELGRSVHSVKKYLFKISNIRNGSFKNRKIV